MLVKGGTFEGPQLKGRAIPGSGGDYAYFRPDDVWGDLQIRVDVIVEWVKPVRAVPLLALSQPLQFAVPLVLALDFTASLVLGSTNSKKANWSEIKILLPAGIAVRIFELLPVLDVGEELLERAGEADLALDPLHLIVDPADLAKADLVDLGGGEVVRVGMVPERPGTLNDWKRVVEARTGTDRVRPGYRRGRGCADAAHGHQRFERSRRGGAPPPCRGG